MVFNSEPVAQIEILSFSKMKMREKKNKRPSRKFHLKSEIFKFRTR